MINNENLKFVNYDERFSQELSTWIDIEKQQGLSGLKDFVVVGDVDLSEFLRFVKDELSIETKIALNNQNLVCGFICYSEIEQNHIHIECLGVNPSLRKMGIAKQLLVSLKETLLSQNPNIEITLAVKKTNIAGIRSFSKVSTDCPEATTSDEYLGLKL